MERYVYKSNVAPNDEVHDAPQPVQLGLKAVSSSSPHKKKPGHRTGSVSARLGCKPAQSVENTSIHTLSAKELDQLREHLVGTLLEWTDVRHIKQNLQNQYGNVRVVPLCFT